MSQLALAWIAAAIVCIAGSARAQAHIEAPPQSAEPLNVEAPARLDPPGLLAEKPTLRSGKPTPRLDKPLPESDKPANSEAKPSALSDILSSNELQVLEARAEQQAAQPAQPAWPDDVQAAYWKRHVAEQEYWERYWLRRESAFAWQHTSGLILFWVVVLMTVVGLIMAGYQFSKDKPADGHAVVHTVELSKDGLKLSSSFAGIVVLAMSLSFLYLYLAHVYPISFVAPSPSQSESDDDS